jgi:hypothetical protein
MELPMNRRAHGTNFAMASVARDCRLRFSLPAHRYADRLFVQWFAGVGGFPPRNLTLNWYRHPFCRRGYLEFRSEQPAGCTGSDGDLADLWYPGGTGARSR